MAKPLEMIVAAALFAGIEAGVASANPVIHYPSVPSLQANPFVRHRHTPPRPPARRMYVNPYVWYQAHKTGSWQPVTNNPPFASNGAGTPLQMTDGTVMIQDNESNWFRLTPDINGSYVNGTWSQAASLPSGYAPLYFASAVLADGRLVVEGGEYNFFNLVETNLGAIYDPLTNKWTSITAPSGWSEIGDAQSAVFPDGTFMLGNCCASNQALLNLSGFKWTTTGSGKFDANSEEGWTLLANGMLLTADVISQPHSELYNQATGTWSSAGTVPVSLASGEEIGPQTLRPDGTVWVEGATGHNAVYDSTSGTWKTAPDFPIVGGRQLDVADGPSALEPNGMILTAASPGLYNAPATFFEWTGKKLVQAPNPPDAPNDSSYNVRLMVLPNGQILETDGTNDVEIYTPGKKAKKKWAPAITSVPTTVTHGMSYTLSGTLINGFSQANMYGDDSQSATNYPIVRITNNSTGHVFYARTHNHSTMAVASTAPASTTFDVPAGIETGASSIVVVANGIASAPVSVTVN